MISCAIPHYNNAKFMEDTLRHIIVDTRIDEIIICDDKSNSDNLTELKCIIKKYDNDKIKLIENTSNIGCYHNKIKSVSLCTQNWVILFDSDNILNKNYIDCLYTQYPWNDMTIYAPCNAITFPGTPSSNLNYNTYSGRYITRQTYLHDFNSVVFKCLINNCNYFVSRKNFIECHSHLEYNRNLIDSLDSAVLFTDWLCYGGQVKVVHGMEYKHRLHKNSNYVTSPARCNGKIVEQVLLSKIKRLCTNH